MKRSSFGQAIWRREKIFFFFFPPQVLGGPPPGNGWRPWPGSPKGNVAEGAVGTAGAVEDGRWPGAPGPPASAQPGLVIRRGGCAGHRASGRRRHGSATLARGFSGAGDPGGIWPGWRAQFSQLRGALGEQRRSGGLFRRFQQRAPSWGSRSRPSARATRSGLRRFAAPARLPAAPDPPFGRSSGAGPDAGDAGAQPGQRRDRSWRARISAPKPARLLRSRRRRGPAPPMAVHGATNDQSGGPFASWGRPAWVCGELPGWRRVVGIEHQ